MVEAGRDFVGVGVGALVFDSAGRVFLARRGPAVTNEAGTWEFPGGAVEYGERLADAVCREFVEEYGMHITVERVLGVFDHILPAEQQHWVSVTFVAGHGAPDEPVIREPEKCSAIGWFELSALPEPLSQVSRENLTAYLGSEASADPAGQQGLHR